MDKDIARAMEAVEHAAQIAASDPCRPEFHFIPPAQFMNDVNGPLLHNGWYHIFYQWNPYYPIGWTDDGWCVHMHWGHARSRDLIHWEHLPIAICPGEGESHCASGGGGVTPDGQPFILYTSMLEGNTPDEQVIVFAQDDDLITWERHPCNPVLGYGAHGEPEFDHGWRDPFIFSDGGRTFLTVGATGIGLPLYEATSPDLTSWEYRGIVFDSVQECPNFCRIGDKWVLITSAFEKGVVYSVGSFDPDVPLFTAETDGVMDEHRHFLALYGTNILIDKQDRPVFVGRMIGWPERAHSDGLRAWNGCMSLPRVLDIGNDGRLLQQPLPALATLRGEHTGHENVLLDGGERVLAKSGRNMLEIHLAFDAIKAKRVGMRLGPAGDEKSVVIAYEGNTLRVTDLDVQIEPGGAEADLELRIFLDRTLLEIFVNGGRQTVSKVVFPQSDDLDVAVFADDGSATLKSADVWQLGGVW